MSFANLNKPYGSAVGLRVVQTFPDWFRLVNTCPDLSRLDQTGPYWSRLVQYGPDMIIAVLATSPQVH